jgi:hypothetical protein
MVLAGLLRTARQGRSRIPLLLLAVLLLAPHFVVVHRAEHLRPRLELPHISSGDEPHYLVIVHSLLSDGDLDLRNNYRSVHGGGLDAGAYWAAARTLDHHTQVRLKDGRWVPWDTVFDPQDWRVDGDGLLMAARRPGAPEVDPLAAEYSFHTSAIAALLYPLLRPIRGTAFVEAAAVTVTGLFGVLAMLFYRRLLLHFSVDPAAVNRTTAVAFLGTPLWMYGRSLFLESYLAAFMLGAYALVLATRRDLTAGLLLGLAVQLKPHYLLLALPLAACLAWERAWGRLARFAVPLVIAGALVLTTNALLFGSPLHPPQPFVFGSFKAGIAGLLLSAHKGLFWIVPASFAALALWPAFVRRHGSPAVALLAGFTMFLFAMAWFDKWHAGYCYGPRHIVPVVPLLLVPLVAVDANWARGRRPATAVIAGLSLVSIVFGGIAAISAERMWERHPVEVLRQVHDAVGSDPSTSDTAGHTSGAWQGENPRSRWSWPPTIARTSSATPSRACSRRAWRISN